MLARIVGTGSKVPERVVSNDDLAKFVDTSDEWIRTRTGIRERRFCSKDEACSDLASAAAAAALEMGGIRADEVDCIIVGTVTGDMPFPSTACLVQERLGAKNAAAFDVSAGCAGFLCGLSIASDMIKAGRYETIVVVGSEVLSRFLDWEDRTTCVLFGDGAGAAVLRPDDSGAGVLSTHIKSDGSYAMMLHMPAGGSRRPASEETVRNHLHYVKMEGQATFKMAVRAMASIAQEALDYNNLTIEQIDLIVPHQANWRIIESVVKRIGSSIDKVVPSIEKYGNTSAASIPIALDEAVRGKLVKRGHLLLMTAFGAGYTWGSAIVRW